MQAAPVFYCSLSSLWRTALTGLDCLHHGCPGGHQGLDLQSSSAAWNSPEAEYNGCGNPYRTPSP